jgi:hypothetical protein
MYSCPPNNVKQLWIPSFGQGFWSFRTHFESRYRPEGSHAHSRARFVLASICVFAKWGSTRIEEIRRARSNTVFSARSIISLLQLRRLVAELLGPSIHRSTSSNMATLFHRGRQTHAVMHATSTEGIGNSDDNQVRSVGVRQGRSIEDRNRIDGASSRAAYKLGGDARDLNRDQISLRRSWVSAKNVFGARISIEHRVVGASRIRSTESQQFISKARSQPFS